jgi:hypothetical protein
MAKLPIADGFPFQLRPGVDPFGGLGWKGVNTEADPGSLAPNELQWAENVRLAGKGILSRPGYSLVLDVGSDAGSVYWFGALPVDNPRTRLWMTALAVFDPNPSALRTGSSVYHIDPSESPVFQTHSKFYSEAGSIAVLSKYGARLYVGERDTVKELVDLTAPVGLNLTDISPTPAAIPIIRFPGYTVRALQEFDGCLFISLENNTTSTSSKVIRWDGDSFEEDLISIPPILCFGIWRDKLVGGIDETNLIRVRDEGTAPGTWNTFTDAAFHCEKLANSMQEDGPYLYIASGREDVWRFDGTALTLVHTISGAGSIALSGCNALTLHNGLLYYGWNVDGTEEAVIGRHDIDSSATGWIDSYKDMASDEPDFKLLTAMKSYRGQIYCGGRQMWVVATKINDVKGSVEIINTTGIPTDDFRVVGFVRYP